MGVAATHPGRASRGALAAAGVGLTLLLAGGCTVPAAHTRPWYQADVPGLQIASSFDAEKTRELAEQLQLFAAVVQLVTKAGARAAPVPTRVYAFDRSSDFRRFTDQAGVAGFFYDTPRENFLVVREQAGVETTHILFHEYTHFLVRNHSRSLYPAWFDEGFAEYMAATKIEEDQIVIGGPVEGRFRGGTWLPMRRLLNAQGVSSLGPFERNAFYGQSWALVHYLMDRQFDGEPFEEQMMRYLDLREDGVRSDRAFEEAFGLSARQLDRTLQKYLEKGPMRILGLRRSEIPVEPLPAAVPKAKAQVASELGFLSLVLGKLDDAEHFFRVALETAPQDGRALAGLGDVRKFRGAYDEAEPYYRRAIAASPQDARVELDYAEYFHDRARREGEKEGGEETARGLMAQAREHYVRAWKLDPEIPEIYFMYGMALETDDPEKAIRMLEEAHARLGSDLAIRYRLGQLYAKRGRTEDAARMLESVAAWTHDDDFSDEVRSELEVLGQGDDASGS